MSILIVLPIFVFALIVVYIILATIFFSKSYKVKADELFSDAVKNILENSEPIDSKYNDDANKVSIKSLIAENPNFQYLKKNCEGEK